jgi:hypothetical protein
MIAVPLLVTLASADGASGLKGDGKYGAAGCGLGSMAFHDQKGFIQIVAATVNNILVPQTSAITTGTSNCAEDGVAMKDKEKEFFANTNFESLHQEMAQGQGENLFAFASLFGCKGEGLRQFAEATHTHYTSIFPSVSTNSQEMLSTVSGMVKTTPALQASCSENG